MSKIFIHFIFIFSSLFSQTSSAKNSYFATSPEACSTIDFRDSFPLLMRDQGKTSWCYANAAADYLQFAYQIPEQISATDIAINYSQTNLSRFIQFFESISNKKARLAPAQTGIIKYAIQAAIPQGYCAENDLPSDAWTKTFPDHSSQKVEILTAIHDLYFLQKQVKSRRIKHENELPYFFSFPQVNEHQFFELLRRSKHKNLLLHLRNETCGGLRHPFPTPSTSSRFYLKSRNVFTKINKSFDQKQSLTIDFSKDAFRNLDHFNAFAWHTVLLYGRRFDPIRKECTYLMKNSHGSSCAPDGVPYDPRLQCDAGYLWFPESALYRAMTSVLTFHQSISSKQ